MNEDSDTVLPTDQEANVPAEPAEPSSAADEAAQAAINEEVEPDPNPPLSDEPPQEPIV